ncbi:uncharacterized protein At1g43920, Chloroplastic-like [Eutrema salsugineum]|uniref:uncharacterized protein At1g43920, Chloroplastic-like n=1 Tax=Eutrema salsugineum TaxID=72664 RepID=UPI000CED14E0|nr:uncharacterized protein At1g43920, Chloroplastic-like [Eutrema salsugineum]
MSFQSTAFTPTYSRGIPRCCSCGQKTAILKSTTVQNPGREFYRCIAAKKGDYGHVFKWVDEAKSEELDILTESNIELQNEITILRSAEANLKSQVQTILATIQTLKNETQATKQQLRIYAYSTTSCCIVVLAVLLLKY